MPNYNDIQDWEGFLETYGMKHIVNFGDWIMCLCPFHEQSDKSRPSFGIEKETGRGNCFGCGNHSWEEICERFGIDATDSVDAIRSTNWKIFMDRIHNKIKRNKFLRYKMPDNLVRPYHRKSSEIYFNSRHIDRNTLDFFQISTCIDGASRYYDHALFPIYDEKGLLYYDARYCGECRYKPRWITPKLSPRHRTYFNFPYGRKVEYLCFVEGATDAMRMWQIGLKNTIPAKNFSQRQIELILKSGAKKIFLAYDQDEAGRNKLDKNNVNISFEAKAKTLFSNGGMEIKVVLFENNCKDPCDIRSELRFLNQNSFLKEFI